MFRITAESVHCTFYDIIRMSHLTLTSAIQCRSARTCISQVLEYAKLWRIVIPDVWVTTQVGRAVTFVAPGLYSPANGENITPRNFSIISASCPWSHGVQPKIFMLWCSSATSYCISPQLTTTYPDCHVSHLSGDNEVKPGTVHKSPGIYLRLGKKSENLSQGTVS